MTKPGAFEANKWYFNKDPNLPLIYSLRAHFEAIQAVYSDIHFRLAIPFIDIEPDREFASNKRMVVRTATSGVARSPNTFWVPERHLIATREWPPAESEKNKWAWITHDQPTDAGIREANGNQRPCVLIDVQTPLNAWQLSSSGKGDRRDVETCYEFAFTPVGASSRTIYIPEHHVAHNWLAIRLFC